MIDHKDKQMQHFIEMNMENNKQPANQPTSQPTTKN